LARRSLKPQLNQIRTWVRQGRTDAWIAHQLEVSVSDIRGFKREHGLAPAEADNGDGEAAPGAGVAEEPDLRAEDDALVAAALEEEAEEEPEPEPEPVSEAESEPAAEGESGEAQGEGGEAQAEAGEAQARSRRRGRRGGRGRGRGRGGGPRSLEGTFDHGDEGYGLWLDPAVQDDPVYAEHWAGHRPVTIVVEAERIVITRAGDDGGGGE
jgi:hypothetical protein